ncbi:MAG: hypothetical protein MJ106_04620, partial [Lentisphaeria bacterium]|nr:hypothetical protein [Lentisphaeria bacterium]
MHKFTLFVCALLSAAALFAATNLLPPPGAIWGFPGRNADGVSSFGIEELDGKPAFHIVMHTPEGYTHYRREKMRLEAGEYTVSCLAKGNTQHGLNIEIYSFDASGKPTLICNYKSPAGAISSPILMHTYFTVPKNSAHVRVGFGIIGKGEGYFAEPTLYAGKVAPAANAPVAPKLSAAQEGWLASWIFLKNDPGEPRMDFTKRFTLDAAVDNATLQLTADNGYEILVNGESIGSDVDWQNTEVYDIAPFLKKGENTILVHLLNYDGLGGLLLQSVIHDANGKETVITSDETWELALPDGRPCELEVLGKVPLVPWGNVTYHKILPPKSMNLKMLECENTTVAGGMLHYVFETNDEFLSKKEPKLAFQFTDASGRITPISAFSDFVRIVPERNRLYIDVATSAYAMPGTYRAEILGDGFTIHAGQITINPSDAPKKCGYKLPKPSLSNTFTTENFSQSLFTYSLYSSLDESHYRSWADT